MATGSHAPFFPFEKAEGWALVLVNAKNGGVLGAAAPPRAWAEWKPATASPGKAASGGACVQWTGNVKLRVPLELAGTSMKMEVHALCSAYVGADVAAPLVVPVMSGAAAAQARKEEESGSDETDDETDDEEEDVPGEIEFKDSD